MTRHVAPALALVAVLLALAGCAGQAPAAPAAPPAPPQPVAAPTTIASAGTDAQTGYLIKKWGQEAARTSNGAIIARFVVGQPVAGPRCSPYTEKPAAGAVYRDIPISVTTAPASTAGVEDLVTLDLVGAWALRSQDGTSTSLPLATCHTDISAVPYSGLQPGRTYKFTVTVTTPADVAGSQLELRDIFSNGGWAWNL